MDELLSFANSATGVANDMLKIWGTGANIQLSVAQQQAAIDQAKANIGLNQQIAALNAQAIINQLKGNANVASAGILNTLQNPLVLGGLLLLIVFGMRHGK